MQHKSRSPKINYPLKLLCGGFLFFVFFPYISFIDIGTDSQPYALILSALVLIVFGIKLSETGLYLLALLLFAIAVFLVDDITFNSARSLINYAALFFISAASYKVLKSGYIDAEKFIRYSFFVWFCVALMQTIYSRDFLGFLVASSRSSVDRGVTGLAPEPTFLGMVFIFYLIFSLHIGGRLKHWITGLSVVGIVMLAKSPMALLSLLIMLFLYMVIYFSVRRALLGAVLLSFLAVALLMMGESRITYIIANMAINPSFLLLDASVNDRFFQILFSLKGFIENFLMPHGYSKWESYAHEQAGVYYDWVILEWFAIGGRILSGYGGALFELGFVALLVPFAISKLLYGIYSDNIRKFLFHAAFINVIMLSAIPVGFPLFAFYFGLLQFLKENKKRKKSVKNNGMARDLPSFQK
jgi:hypothetical protein